MAVQRRVLGGISQDDDPTLDPTTYDQPQAPQRGPGSTTTPGDSTQGTIPLPPNTAQPGPTDGSGVPPVGGYPSSNPSTTVAGAPMPTTGGPGVVPGTSYGGPSGAPPPHSTLQAPADGNWEQWFANLEQGQPSSYAAINQWEPQLNNAGVKVSRNLSGDPSKIILPNGDYVSIVDANGKWRWMDQGQAGSQQGGDASASLPNANISPFDFNSLPQVGNDPLSRSTDAKLQELIDNNGRVQDTNGQIEALNLENARGMADRARKAEQSGVDATLANRGLLDQYDPSGGAHANSANLIERNDIAPLFSDAVRSYMINDNNNASQRLTSALGDVTTRQGVLSNIALQSLAQNTAFDEFAATYGLQKDQILEQLKTGNDSNLINLMEIFLQRNGQLNTGFH